MIRWTTPTLQCSIPSDIIFDYILITLKQGNVVIEKQIEQSSVVDGKFNVFFTQKETGKFVKECDIEVQCNIMNGGTRLATNIVNLRICKNLHDGIINETM